MRNFYQEFQIVIKEVSCRLSDTVIEIPPFSWDKSKEDSAANKKLYLEYLKTYLCQARILVDKIGISHREYFNKAISRGIITQQKIKQAKKQGISKNELTYETSCLLIGTCQEAWNPRAAYYQQTTKENKQRKEQQERAKRSNRKNQLQGGTKSIKEETEKDSCTKQHPPQTQWRRDTANRVRAEQHRRKQCYKIQTKKKEK
jgi:hypothetical protein